MGRSIRSKRGKALRTVKRSALDDVEQLKVKVLRAKLNRYVTQQTADESDIKPEDFMPVERDPIEFALDPTPRFTHSHPKPRDPNDPTIRPFPRGRPQTEQVKRVIGSAPSGGMTFSEALARQQAMQIDDNDAESSAVKAEVMNDEDDDDDNRVFDGEVTYVSTGKGGKVRRLSGKQRTQRRTTNITKKKGTTAAVLRSWKRIHSSTHK